MKRFDGYGGLTLIGLLLALPLSCLLISQQKSYWFDELFSYYFLSDSFMGMVRAFHDKINNTPFVYFLFGWLWAQVFGASEASLRLFSSLGMVLAALATWVLLRRRHGPWPAAFATACVFGLSHLVLEQNVEARMYGLYLALAALAILLFDRLQAEAPPPAKAAVVGVGIVHALLLHTHLFGIFYSATIIAVGLLADTLQRRGRPRLYLAYALAWASLLAYLPAFLVQADAGRPRTWIPPPTLGDLLWFYLVETVFAWHGLIAVVLVGLGLGVFSPLRRLWDPAALRRVAATEPTTLLGWALVVLPLGLWLLSLTIKPVFIDRYMIPSLLGVAILLAEAIAAFDRHHPSSAPGTSRPDALFWPLYRSPAARTLLLLVFLTTPFAYAAWRKDGEIVDFSRYDFGHPDLPIVLQYTNQFVQQVHYIKDDARVVYVLDWDSAVSPASGNFPPQEYKHMEALLRNYPARFEERVVAGEDFLRDHDRFLVWDNEDYDRACEPSAPWHSLRRNTNKWLESLQCPRFLEEVLLRDPRYAITVAGRIDHKESDWGDSVVLLVEKKPD